MMELFSPPAASGMILMDKRTLPPGAYGEGVGRGCH